MILHCQQCHTRFLVGPSTIGPQGRMVRCAKCGHDWFQQPETPDSALPPAPAPSPEPEPIPDFAKALVEETLATPGLPVLAGARGVPKGLKWGAGALALLALVTALFAFQPALVRMVPALQKAYDLVGVSDTSGLVLADVYFKKLPSAKRERYAVYGKIVNQSSQPRRLPILRISLVDEDGNVLQYRDSGEAREIKPKEEIAFRKEEENRFRKGVHFTVEIGNALELFLRD